MRPVPRDRARGKRVHTYVLSQLAELLLLLRVHHNLAYVLASLLMSHRRKGRGRVQVAGSSLLCGTCDRFVGTLEVLPTQTNQCYVGLSARNLSATAHSRIPLSLYLSLSLSPGSVCLSIINL